MTYEELDDGIERIPVKDCPWGKYFLAVIDLDKGKKPYGYHWFWGLHLLDHKFSYFDFEKAKRDLPEGNHFKEIDRSALENLLPHVDTLRAAIGDPVEIDKIDFSGLIFENAVDFSNFMFPVPADFKNTVFLDAVHFISVNFYQADFVNAHFFSRAAFSGIEVSVGIDFSKAKFFFNASFIRAKINGIAEFNQTIFSGVPFFQDITFKQSAYFIDAKFETHVPRFYNATLNIDIIWAQDINCWPQIKKHENDETDGHYRGRILENRNAYENLASHMKKMDRDHDEHFFFRQETRCRQQFEKNYFTYCSYWLYGKFADYGYGIESAVAAWFWHMVLGAQAIAIVAFANAWLAGWKDGAWVTAKSVLCSIPLSFANAHGFLPFHKGALSGCYTYFMDSNFFNTIWAFQTVLGVIFLFLFLLTLRIRFRLK